MLYRNIKTGNPYRKLLESFDAKTQTHATVYLCMTSGVVFHRDTDEFNKKFVVIADPQSTVIPKAPLDLTPGYLKAT
jgi:hypothetical protein